jgi:hypothetical protein
MTWSETLAAMLSGGDRRSLGRSEAAVKLVLPQPRRFGELMECLSSEDPVLRMRAADAADKVSAQKPRLLDRHKAELLGLLAEAEQIELRKESQGQKAPRTTPRLKFGANPRVSRAFCGFLGSNRTPPRAPSHPYRFH